MIKEVTMYTVICDNCGKDLCEGQEFSCWNDDLTAHELAMEENWIKEESKHYCPDCYDYDDNDNLVINESRKKEGKSCN